MKSFRTTTVLIATAILVCVPMVQNLKAADIVAPIISAVTVSGVTENSAVVTWKTNEGGDSVLNYGLSEDYGIRRDPTSGQTDHKIVLDALEPGRKYHFRVVSSDADGNQGISTDYQVTTSGTPSDQSQSQSQSQTETQQTVQTQTQSQQNDQIKTDQIIQDIKQIQSPEKLKEILNQTVSAIQGITKDLTIVGPPTVIPETTTAKIMWTTDRESTGEVSFSPADKYIEGQAYAFQQQSTDAPTTDHNVTIIGLEPFTEYHFKVRSADTYNISGESRDYTFKTKASLPQIRNLRIVKVEETSATLAWDTTVPAKALIEYQDLAKGTQNSIGRPTLASTNQMRISDLTLGTRYIAFVIAENGGGDRVKSSPISFITVRDREPPIISNVTNQSTLFPGSEAQIQTIIQWNTDEPSYCTLQYREGVAPGADATTLKSEDQSYTTKHTDVITDFSPGTVYKFNLTCADAQTNAITSEDFVLFTPVKEKNIIDIIIENFQGAFGWVKNIGGKK